MPTVPAAPITRAPNVIGAPRVGPGARELGDKLSQVGFALAERRQRAELATESSRRFSDFTVRLGEIRNEVFSDPAALDKEAAFDERSRRARDEIMDGAPQGIVDDLNVRFDAIQSSTRVGVSRLSFERDRRLASEQLKSDEDSLVSEFATAENELKRFQILEIHRENLQGHGFFEPSDIEESARRIERRGEEVRAERVAFADPETFRESQGDFNLAPEVADRIFFGAVREIKRREVKAQIEGEREIKRRETETFSRAYDSILAARTGGPDYGLEELRKDIPNLPSGGLTTLTNLILKPNVKQPEDDNPASLEILEDMAIRRDPALAATAVQMEADDVISGKTAIRFVDRAGREKDEGLDLIERTLRQDLSPYLRETPVVISQRLTLARDEYRAWLRQNPDAKQEARTRQASIILGRVSSEGGDFSLVAERQKRLRARVRAGTITDDEMVAETLFINSVLKILSDDAFSFGDEK